MKKLAFLLIPLFGLFFTSNSFALQHNYDSLLTVQSLYLPPLVRDSNQLYYRDFNSTVFDQYNGPATAGSWLEMTFPSSFTPQFTPYSGQESFFLSSAIYSDNMSYDNGQCKISAIGSPSYYQIRSNWVRGSSSVSIYGRYLIVGGGYNPTSNIDPVVTGDTFKCYTSDHAPYTYVNNNPLNFYFRVLGYDNVTGNRAFNPLPDNKVQSYNGISLSQTQTHQSSGITYSTSFSFSRLFDGTDNFIPYVRKLKIPLLSSDGYFQKYQNLTSGRQLEWHFSFQFTDTFEHPSDMSHTYARVRLYGLPRLSQRSDYVNLYGNCTETVTHSMLDDETRYTVDYSCPVTLDTDYSDFSLIDFELGNENDDFVFHTTKEWSFFSAYLVTDNDYTQGDSFNTDLEGDIWGANNGQPTGESDIQWLDSVVNMLSFSYPFSRTPMGMLFYHFIDPNTCASIPTLAGMLHSNETQVCPWFSSETRAITTPVLSLFAGFLVFGFIMHWLGSSSGNFIEDSESHSLTKHIKVGKK